jgi:hypothetical protein
MTVHAAHVAPPSISPDEMLRRLMRANGRDIADIVIDLSPQERARLAFFCYARGHLQDIGIAIAATCDLPFLLQMAPSNAAGQTLFARSRQGLKAAVAPANRRRPAITLAKSALGNDGLAKILASIAGDETDSSEPDIAPADGIARAPAVC